MIDHTSKFHTLILFSENDSDSEDSIQLSSDDEFYHSPKKSKQIPRGLETIKPKKVRSKKSTKKIVKLHNCKHCGRAFNQSVNLKKHEICCLDGPSPKNRICPCCNKKFTRSINLLRHQESIHAKKDPEFAKTRY